MNDTAKIEQDLLQFLCNEFGLSKSEIDVNTPLFSKNYLDSMDLINIVTYLEQTFGIKIAALEVNLDAFDTIRSISQYISKKIQS